MQKKPRIISGLDIWLAKNPATPADILEALTETKDINVIQNLLQNPKIDCAMLKRLEQALPGTSRPDDNYTTGRLAELKAKLCGALTQR